MPYDIKRLIFSVSLCAILAVNPVLATAPGENESVGSAHTVYDGTKLGKATKGIAGVGYVNSMVDAAGNAAQAAEAHAAAAGASALSAAESADEARAVLKDKVKIAQGTDNKNKAMVTDDGGSVVPGYIISDMISAGRGGTESRVLKAISATGVGEDYVRTEWGYITADNIGYRTIQSTNISLGAVTTDEIANGAVTIDKTAGVVGRVPVGSEGANIYGSFWIE